jgi:hypothetical protein
MRISEKKMCKIIISQNRNFHLKITSTRRTISDPLKSNVVLTIKEELRLRVFENRALGRIFGPKRDEVTGQ